MWRSSFRSWCAVRNNALNTIARGPRHPDQHRCADKPGRMVIRSIGFAFSREVYHSCEPTVHPLCLSAGTCLISTLVSTASASFTLLAVLNDVPAATIPTLTIFRGPVLSHAGGNTHAKMTENAGCCELIVAWHSVRCYGPN